MIVKKWKKLNNDWWVYILNIYLDIFFVVINIVEFGGKEWGFLEDWGEGDYLYSFGCYLVIFGCVD